MLDTNNSAPAFAIVPYESRRNVQGDMQLDLLDWPVGRPARLRVGTVADMGPQDHLVTFPTTAVYFRRRPWLRAQLSLVIVEPDAIHRKHALLAGLFFWRFHRILTRNLSLLRWLPRARRFVFGSSQITDDRTVDLQKTSLLSIIASGKRDLEGHRLRHQVIDMLRERGLHAAILGRGYAPFDRKEDGLAPFHYSIIVENVREPSYFTEKLIDAFLCRTIPIYWGAPDIGSFFDIEGMIICDCADDICAAVAELADPPTAAMLNAAERNRLAAQTYANLHLRIALTIANEVSGKGL